MADQNQNPLSTVLEDEQFVSSEGFSSADNALDWDLLVSRGNANNTQPSLTKWDRESLYMKFDPLVTSRSNPNPDRTSFIFKAPKPPVPVASANINNIDLTNSDSDSSYQTASQDLTWNETFLPIKYLDDDSNTTVQMTVDESLYVTVPDGSEMFGSLNDTVITVKSADTSINQISPSVKSLVDEDEFAILGDTTTKLKSPEMAIIKPRMSFSTQDDVGFQSCPDNGNSSITETSSSSTAPLNTSYVVLSPSEQPMDEEHLDVEFQHELSLSQSNQSPNPDLVDTLPLDGEINFPVVATVESALAVSIVEEKPGDVSMSLSFIEQFERMKMADTTVESHSEDSVVINRSFTIAVNNEDEDGEDSVLSVSGYTTDPVSKSSVTDNSVIHLDAEISYNENNETLSEILAPSSFAMESEHDTEEQLKKTEELDEGFSTTHRGRPRMSAGDMSDFARDDKKTRVSSRRSEPNALASPYSDQLARISQLKETNAILMAEYEEQKQLNNQDIMQFEVKFQKVVDELTAKEEEYQHLMEEKKKRAEERDQALDDLRNMEAGFAEMLMMYENSKACHAQVEKNCEILKAREVGQGEALKQRETRDNAAYDTFMERLNIMKHDFETRVKEREAENLKLKAKLRMADMKTQKLESEIVQIDRESEKLRVLCDDLLKS